MNRLAPLCVLLIPLAAIAVATAGPAGATIAALTGLLIATAAMLLVQGNEAAPRGGLVARRESITRFLMMLVVGGFVVRALIAVLLRQFELNQVLGTDEQTFHVNAHVFRAWLDGVFPEPFQSRWRNTSQIGYFAFVGTLYWLFGPIQLVPVFINCLVGSLTAIPIYRLTARMGGDLAGRIGAVVATFFPSLVLWSCLLVRDALAFFLIAWCAVLGQGLLRRATASRLVMLISCLGLLATLRSYMFLLLAAALVASFVISIVRRPGRALVVAVVSTVGVLLLVRGAGLGAEFLGEDYLGRIHEQRRVNALGGSAGFDLGGHDLTTPGGALTYLPIGLAYFLLAPFPWQMGGRQVLALPDMVLWYACIPLVVLGAIHALRWRRSAALVPLLAGISISMLYGLVEGNVGIIVRHRAQVLVLFVPFAAVIAARMVRARRRRLAEQQERRERAVRPVAWAREAV